MHTFKEHGFEKVEGYIPLSFSTFLKNYFAVRVENDPSLVGDAQAPNSNSVYGDAAFDVVMAMSTEDIGRIVGKKLIPQYSYARIYKKGSVLPSHTDRRECQYSVTLCLGGEYEKDWPIVINDYSGKSHEIPLNEGDMLVYSGCELYHWRDEFEGDKQYQLFMHYVDAHGEFGSRVFDGRDTLGSPWVGAEK